MADADPVPIGRQSAESVVFLTPLAQGTTKGRNDMQSGNVALPKMGIAVLLWLGRQQARAVFQQG